MSEKSTPPTSSPMTGMMICSTRLVTIEVNAAPRMMPTARSMALPLTANSLNSFHMVAGGW